MRIDFHKEAMTRVSNTIARKLGLPSEVVKVIKLVGDIFVNIEFNTIDIDEDEVMALTDTLGVKEVDFGFSSAMWEQHGNPTMVAKRTEGDKKIIAEVKEAKEVKTLRIHDLANDTVYDIASPSQARCGIARMAAVMAEEHGTIITLGKVVVEHLPSKYPDHTLIKYYKGQPSKGEPIPKPSDYGRDICQGGGCETVVKGFAVCSECERGKGYA